MVEDLCLTGSRGSVEIVGAETVREPDGLALSSRNRYLDDEQRHHAVVLQGALRAAQQAAANGVDAALAAANDVLRTAPGVELDYLTVTTPDLGQLPAEPPAGTEARILVAARLGSTRLIDNLPLTIGRPL